MSKSFLVLFFKKELLSYAFDDSVPSHAYAADETLGVVSIQRGGPMSDVAMIVLLVLAVAAPLGFAMALRGDDR